jgi:hypothetical protein
MCPQALESVGDVFVAAGSAKHSPENKPVGRNNNRKKLVKAMLSFVEEVYKE